MTAIPTINPEIIRMCKEELFNKAKAYFYSGSSEEAFFMFKRLLKISPNYIDLESGTETAYYYLGLIYVNTFRNINKAIENFNRSIALCPNDSYSYEQRGYCWFYKKSYDKAVSDLKMARTNNNHLTPEIEKYLKMSEEAALANLS